VSAICGMRKVICGNAEWTLQKLGLGLGFRLGFGRRFSSSSFQLVAIGMQIGKD